MKATIYTDGGARPINPGHAAFACIVELEDDTNSAISRYIGWQSNNVAEYYGAIVGIKFAKFLGATHITLVTDSKLVRNQIQGEWKVKSAELRALQGEAVKLLDEFESWKIKWVGRKSNQKADAMCTAAIYAGMLQNPWWHRNGKGKLAQEVDPFNGRATINMLMPSDARVHLQSHARTLINHINKTK